MRVCLITPPRIQPKFWGKPSVLQPLDIAYVAALLERQHNLSIIDAPTEGWRNLEAINEKQYRLGLTNKEISARVKQWSPDLVVIAIPFSGWSKSAFDVASAIKSNDKDLTTMLIGLHPSARPADCLTHPSIDFVGIGEPEQTVFELADFLEQGKDKDPKNIRGIAYTKDEKTVITPPRPEIQDLDSLPFPARHLLPMEAYFAAVKENPLRGEVYKRWSAMVTSRGCPYNCIFCTIHTVMGRKWRARSPQNVIEELEQLVQHLPR